MSIFSYQSRSSSNLKKGLPAGRQGFTLIELLVVMSIMVIVTGIMLVRQSKFDSSTILRSLAYSVALSIRQAQVYGTSVLGTSTLQAACIGGTYYTGNCYASAYGIYFNSTTPSQYTLFADLNSNGQYDLGEDAKIFQLGTGYSISQFCVAGSNGGVAITAPGRCWFAAGGSTISSLSVVFKRPNPDAQFTALQGDPVSGSPICTPTCDIYSSATIQIQNQGDTGTVRSATVTNTGLVSAQ